MSAGLDDILYPSKVTIQPALSVRLLNASETIDIEFEKVPNKYFAQKRKILQIMPTKLLNVPYERLTLGLSISSGFFINFFIKISVIVNTPSN